MDDPIQSEVTTPAVTVVKVIGIVPGVGASTPGRSEVSVLRSELLIAVKLDPREVVEGILICIREITHSN
jgi:hypothetical protein